MSYNVHFRGDVYLSLLQLSKIFPFSGETGRGDCSKGNGTGNKPNGGHFRDHKGQKIPFLLQFAFRK